MPQLFSGMFSASDGRVDLMVTTEQDSSAAALERRFGGTRRLYGERALERFREAHVCVIGIGGVGNLDWAEQEDDHPKADKQ